MTSPQDTIARVKDHLSSSLHEIRLFQDDFGVLTRAIGRLMWDNLRYLGACSVALVPMIVVVLPILFQLDARYGFAPRRPGDRVVLQATLRSDLDPVEHTPDLELPEGVVLEAGPVRVRRTHEAAWRLRIERPGDHVVALRVGGERFEKRLPADPTAEKVMPARYSEARTLDALMFPAEPPLPADAPIQAIEVTLERRAMLGMDGDTYPWLVIFCVVGLLFGFALKGVFKVNL